MPDQAPKRIVVGKLSGVYGVKGWLKVYSWTDPRENILTYKRWWLNTAKGWVEQKVVQGKVHGKGLIVLLDGCSSRNDAEALKGLEISVYESDLARLKKDEYYWRDLIGLQVINCQDIEFGKVHSLIETGSNNVLVVRGEEERLVPWVMNQYIKNVDLDAGVITVDWDAEF